jgi:ribonuclease P/MRP protein subunit RPP20
MADSKSFPASKSGGKPNNPVPTDSSQNPGPGVRTSGRQNSFNKKEDRNQGKQFVVKKRPPTKASRRINDVYIGEGSSFQSQFVKCQQLLDGGQKVVYLHGLGDAIPRAFNLAAKLKEQYKGSLDFSVTTSTVKLVDDLLPVDDNTLPSQNYRTKSAVNIKVFRTVDLP